MSHLCLSLCQRLGFVWFTDKAAPKARGTSALARVRFAEGKLTSNLVTDLSDHFPNFISIKGPRFESNNIPKPSFKQIRQPKENDILR